MRGVALVRARELSLSGTSGLAVPARGQSAFQRSTVVKLRPRPVRGQRLTHAWRGGQPEGSLYVYSGDAPCAAKRRIYSPHAEVRRQAYGKALCCSARVRRQGLEPRTRGLRVGRSGVPGVLPAQCPHADARKAQGYSRCSFHEPFHGIGTGPAGSVTVSDGRCQEECAPTRLIVGTWSATWLSAVAADWADLHQPRALWVVPLSGIRRLWVKNRLMGLPRLVAAAGPGRRPRWRSTSSG